MDVEQASGGRFSADIASLYPVWSDLVAWAGDIDDAQVVALDRASLGNPAPRPAQVFAVGLNYADHAAESNLATERTLVPPTFTKFPSSLSGPFSPLRLAGPTVDWEVELVAVIGRTATGVAVDEAWSSVAGLAVGQDFSERTVQSAGPAPQFSLGKSYPGFGPIGPWLVTPDELADPDDLLLTCAVNGEEVQKSRTSQMIWSVPELVSVLSGICTLHPGDVIFTGTPAGVGAARTPPRFLTPGDRIVSRVEGIGEIEQTCLAAD
ncbi:fumarylacetoacetate hydrolase family protein [Pseudonocardia kujensis]|uniref:fumarylacetoacetate hydrolase family protein n=1 Tax=Pseudonocardia kujensis TaxID=1128675 RepID=UPI0027DFE226|nr:fumarylacetoacetate hydrolase family protein [Pseudonocardia kujensis]